MDFDRPGFDREVGLRLQLARKRRGITQAVLAEKIGLPRASYANIEAGRQRIPVDIVWRAAVVLGTQISSLVPEPVNRVPATESVFPSLNGILGDPTVRTVTPGVGGVTYVGTSAYSMDTHLYSPTSPPVVQKAPAVRVIRGSKT